MARRFSCYLSARGGLVTSQSPDATRPDAIWIALWDGRATLDDGILDWPLADRAKQYAGNLSWTVGGITLSIDQDVVAAPLAR